MSPAMTGSIAVFARLTMAAIFLWSGGGALLAPGSTVTLMQQYGMPFAAVLVWPTIALELGGGLALVLGWQTRLAALALGLFTLAGAFIFHAFWAVDPAQVLEAEINFMKNVAIFGGSLMLVANGAGRYSLDALRSGRGRATPGRMADATLRARPESAA